MNKQKRTFIIRYSGNYNNGHACMLWMLYNHDVHQHFWNFLLLHKQSALKIVVKSVFTFFLPFLTFFLYFHSLFSLSTVKHYDHIYSFQLNKQGKKVRKSAYTSVTFSVFSPSSVHDAMWFCARIIELKNPDKTYTSLPVKTSEKGKL